LAERDGRAVQLVQTELAERAERSRTAIVPPDADRDAALAFVSKVMRISDSVAGIIAAALTARKARVAVSTAADAGERGRRGRHAEQDQRWRNLR
jgi:hypothetical protein